MAKQKTTKETLVKTALDLAAQYGWACVRLSDIAEAAEISLADLHDYFLDKTDILMALGRMIDRQILENANIEENATPRERLFDMLMDRFEVLNDYRDGITAVLDSFYGDPKQAVISLPHLARSMSWMMEAARIDTSGIKGAISVTGITGVYLKTLHTWNKDHSPDLSATMAALDKNLKKACDIGGMFGIT